MNMYKGRCATLSRDVELSQTYLGKMNAESGAQNEQFNYMKERIKNLEQDLERAIREKTDAQFEIKRLEQQV